MVYENREVRLSRHGSGMYCAERYNFPERLLEIYEPLGNLVISSKSGRWYGGQPTSDDEGDTTSLPLGLLISS